MYVSTTYQSYNKYRISTVPAISSKKLIHYPEARRFSSGHLFQGSFQLYLGMLKNYTKIKYPSEDYFDKSKQTELSADFIKFTKEILYIITAFSVVGSQYQIEKVENIKW